MPQTRPGHHFPNSSISGAIRHYGIFGGVAALAALRHFFDALVTRHAVALNPFSSVRGKKHSVVDGKTPELSPGQARALLGSLDLSHAVGLRDRAVLGVLT